MKHEKCIVRGCANEGRYCRKPGHVSETFSAIPMLKKEGDKLKASKKIYSSLASLYITKHPVCEVRGCNAESECIHHKAGKIGDLLIDMSKFLAVCLPCHRKIEDHPEWSRKEGYSLSRLQKEII